MFDEVDDAALVAAIEAHTRAEAVAGAMRLAAIAKLVERRVVEGDERERWACDPWDSAAAEVGAAMGIAPRAASREMRIGSALTERLPKVAALYAEGRLSTKLIATITWRTQLVAGEEAMARIDAAIAERAASWGPLSVAKLERAVDQIVDRHDPGARLRTREAAAGRDVKFGQSDDTTGTTSMWGRLHITDAVALQRRLELMADEVCDDDPRTTAQQRADALGVIGAGGDRLACQCGGPRCPAAAPDARGTSVVIHVIAEQETVEFAAAQSAVEESASVKELPAPVEESDGADNPAVEAETVEPTAVDKPKAAVKPAEIAVDNPPVEAETVDDPAAEEPPAAAPAAAEQPSSALIVGGGVVPTPLLGELIRNGAKLRPIRPPDLGPQPRYRPSTSLDHFVRMRDLTCRFPGCDRAAECCDVDHSVAYPDGATHPSNLKCLCRKHHLLKTFWAGWSGRQLADGSVVWTAPTGHTYTTKPGGQLFFPAWDSATGDAPPGATASTGSARHLMMPKRRQTRAAVRAARIKAERALNDGYVAQKQRPPPF